MRRLTIGLLIVFLTMPFAIALAASQEQQTPPATSARVEAVRIIPGLAWPVFLIIVLIVYRRPLRQFIGLVIWRIRAGSGIEIAGLQLQKLNIPQVTQQGNVSGPVQAMDDPGGEFGTARRELLDNCRGIFLAHQTAPSKDVNQLYDVWIYLVPYDPTDPALTPHPGASLLSVRRVEYFFGPSWSSKVFVSENRANSFPIKLSAWAKFICNARIEFVDGTRAWTWRLIDFEMGSIGSIGPQDLA